jgi:hypothetical protein
VAGPGEVSLTHPTVPRYVAIIPHKEAAGDLVTRLQAESAQQRVGVNFQAARQRAAARLV